MVLFSIYSSGVADREVFGDMTEVHHAEHFCVTAIDVAVLAKRSAARCTLHPAQRIDSALQISSIAVKSPEWGNPNFPYLWLAHQTFIKLFFFSPYIGISGKSQVLFALVFTTRYLDLFSVFISAYNTVMKVSVQMSHTNSNISP